MPAITPKAQASRSAGLRGITLIELLVVMVIISIVTASSIALLGTGVESRRIREASRLVSSYISAAKSRAIETGRPAGVMVQRYAGQSFAVTLVGVEVPPPYAGDTTNSGAFISGGALVGLGTPGYQANPLVPGTIPFAGSADLGWMSLVRVGDFIQLGEQGRSYMLLGNSPVPTPANPIPTFISNTTNLSIAGQLLSAAGFPAAPCYLWATDRSYSTPTATVWTTTFTVPSAGPPVTATNIAVGVPYQILRQPVKSATQPLQMPGDTVIDLLVSGVGVSNTFLVGGGIYQNPTFLFGPTGSVGFAYYDSNPPQHLTGTPFLLIGTRDGMEDLGLASATYNINHHRSMWVAMSPQTGLVVTAENMGPGTAIPSLQLLNARQFAQQASSIGGR